jgi:hypothetical protein
MGLTMHFNCCFQPDCNTLKGFEARLLHYSVRNFDAGERPSVARTTGAEGVPWLRLSYDKNLGITLSFVGFNWFGCQWKSERETATRYFGSFMGRTLKVSFETGYVQNKLIATEKASKDDRMHLQVQDVNFERTLISEQNFNFNHLLHRLTWWSMTIKSVQKTTSRLFSQN